MWGRICNYNLREQILMEHIFNFNTISQNQIKSVIKSELFKKWTAAEDSKAWTTAQRSQVLFSDDRRPCILYGNQAPRAGGGVERHRIQVVPARFHVAVLWFIRSEVSIAVYRLDFRASCFLLLTSFMEMLVFVSWRIGWFKAWGVLVSDWPPNWPDLTPERIFGVCDEDRFCITYFVLCIKFSTH